MSDEKSNPLDSIFTDPPTPDELGYDTKMEFPHVCVHAGKPVEMIVVIQDNIPGGMLFFAKDAATGDKLMETLKQKDANARRFHLEQHGKVINPPEFIRLRSVVAFG